MNPSKYFKDLISLIDPSKEDLERLEQLVLCIKKTHKNGGKIIAVGNGGSASIASHFSVDLSKNGRIRSLNFNEANLITCLTNDAGQDFWITEALKIHCDSNDLVILISSSGESSNILNAAKYCRNKQIELVTFSGMSQHNSLNNLNVAGLKFWVNSHAYNHIEGVHQTWLLYVVDSCIGNSIYEARINQDI